jgi:hypothetical protein
LSLDLSPAERLVRMHDVAAVRELCVLEGIEYGEVRDIVEQYITGDYTPSEFRGACWQRAWDNAVDKAWRPVSEPDWLPSAHIPAEVA